MNTRILFLLIAAQVVAFQFISVRLTRALPAYMIGTEGVPADIAEEADRLRHHAGGLRYALGVILMVCAVLVTFGFGLGGGETKLALATISVLSSGALLAGFLHDRRAVASLVGALPEPATRAALLERRSIGRYYSPAWEWVPILLLLATSVITVRAIPGASSVGGAPAARLFALPAVQAIYVFVCLWLSSRLARTPAEIPQSSRSSHASSRRALELDELLRRMELRFFMAMKIVIVVMLGTMQVQKLISASGSGAAAWLDISVWALVAAAIALFAGYASVVSRLPLEGCTKRRPA